MPADIYSPRDNSHLHSSIKGLHVTPAAPLPFLKGVVTRSFLLQRPAGNVLVYNAPGISVASADIEKHGRPTRLLVNHWHEGMYGAPDLEVPIFVHEKDQAKTKLPIAGTISGRNCIDDDLEVIPTPGHTAGTTMFLWDNGARRLLFPGDSIWVQGGEWKAVLLDEGDRKAYIESLSLLMGIEFDYLVPWGSEEGQPYAYGVTGTQARSNLKAISDRLKAGGDA